MKYTIFALLIIFTASQAYAAQSTITDSEGYACMGDDKSRKQTEQSAMADAKRKAAETALTYIQSETHLKDMEFEKDLVSAYTNAQVKVIQEVSKGWYKEASTGECYKVSIRAEVIPDTKDMEKASKGAADNPSAPLSIRVWTDKQEYRQGDKVKIYLKGNKPFYARVVYKDASGSLIQLLPNPYRTDNYFSGGTVYEIPSGQDKFELDVSPPFGEEDVIVYAGTSQLGDIRLKKDGGVYRIMTKTQDIGDRTRGIQVSAKVHGKGQATAEFVEDKATLKTVK